MVLLKIWDISDNHTQIIQIAKETELKKSLLYSSFTEIESKQLSQINHVCPLSKY